MIDRRKARRSLGSRVSRRAGTKTKAIPGSAGSKLIFNQYTNFRRQKPSPRSQLRAALLEQATD